MTARKSSKSAAHFPRLRVPAEWEPHESTWMAWPHNHEDWPGKFQPIPWVHAEIIRHLTRHERVDLIVDDRRAGEQARKSLVRAGVTTSNVRFHYWPTDRGWLRDSGCTFVFEPGNKQRTRRAVKWRFNAWAKYPNWKQDETIGARMATAANTKTIRALHDKSRVVLEGGSIDFNGSGTLLTTEECLLSDTQSRNPGMSREDYEYVFAQYLGIRQVIWLGSGIAGDDTHGHVDDITRFVAPGTVLTAMESNPDDPNYPPLQENRRRLAEATDQDGRPFQVVELPMPSPVFFEGRRLPASYANFYIANGLVLVPVFNDPNDRVALDVFVDTFPDRDIVPIYCGDLIWGLGAIHCMTQQQPAIPASVQAGPGKSKD